MKFREEKVKIIDSQQFNQFVNSIYGGNFEFEAIEESNNDSSYKFSISKGDYLYAESAEKIRSGKYSNFSTRNVLLSLLEDGHIEEGTYIIDVCW
jgi:hypothetical protein